MNFGGYRTIHVTLHGNLLGLNLTRNPDKSAVPVKSISISIFGALALAATLNACTDGADPTPVPSPTPTSTAIPTVAPTATQTASPTPTPTSTAIPSPAVASTATRTSTPTPTPTSTSTATLTATATYTPTATQNPTATPTHTPTPTQSPTAAPTSTPTTRLDAHTDLNRDRDANTNSYDDLHSICYTHRNARPNTDRHTTPDCDPDGDTNSNSYPHKGTPLSTLEMIPDGIPDYARSAIPESEVRSKMRSFGLSPAQQRMILQLPWIADGVALYENDGAAALIGLAERAKSVFNDMIELPWVKDGLSFDETRVVNAIQWSDASNADAIVTVILGKPWVQDDLDFHEASAVEALISIAQHQSDSVANSILEMPFLETVEPVDALATLALSEWAHLSDYPEYFDLILASLHRQRRHN